MKKVQEKTSPPSCVSLTEQQYSEIISSLKSQSHFSQMDDSLIRQKVDEFLFARKYADPLSDWAFDRAFGKNKSNLLKMLQTLLPDAKIADVERLGNRTLQTEPGQRYGYYDILCRTSDGTLVNVEAQVLGRAAVARDGFSISPA